MKKKKAVSRDAERALHPREGVAQSKLTPGAGEARRKAASAAVHMPRNFLPGVRNHWCVW